MSAEKVPDTVTHETPLHTHQAVTTAAASEAVEKSAQSHIASQWGGRRGTRLVVPQKLNHSVTTWLIRSTPRCGPKRNENTRPHRTHPRVLTAASFVNAGGGNDPHVHQLTNRFIKGGAPATDCYSATKGMRHGHTRQRGKLGNAMRHERSHVVRCHVCDVS